MTDVFISYSRRDLDFVRRLDAALTAQGKASWFDQKKEPANVGTASNARRVACGGAWNHGQEDARAMYRNGCYPTDMYMDLGFRVVCASPI